MGEVCSTVLYCSAGGVCCIVVLFQLCCGVLYCLNDSPFFVVLPVHCSPALYVVLFQMRCVLIMVLFWSFSWRIVQLSVYSVLVCCSGCVAFFYGVCLNNPFLMFSACYPVCCSCSGVRVPLFTRIKLSFAI